MKKNIILILLSLFIGCQDSIDINEPNQKVSLEKLSNFPVADNITIEDSEYNVYLLADNLTSPEGVIYHPRSQGLLVGQSTIGNVVNLDRKDNISEFVNLNLITPPTITLVDLLSDPHRGIFITELRRGIIYLTDKKGNYTEFASGRIYPQFMELDHKKNLFVNESRGNCITKIDANQNKMKIVDFDDEGFMIPGGIVFDKNEKLYVLITSTKEILMYDIKNSSNFPLSYSDGSLIAKLPAESNDPLDITIGFGGDLFLVDANNVWKIKITGEEDQIRIRINRTIQHNYFYLKWESNDN